VLVDQNDELIAGHGRILGAKELGLKTVPVIRLEHLTEAQVKAFRLADNKIALNADWLEDLLKDELSALQGLDFDLSLIGFDDRELQNLLVDDAELERAEQTPAVPENPVTCAGDVWLLGKHRLVCGDSTVASDVDKALAGVKPHLMVTDPPYGVNYDPTWRNVVKRQDGSRVGAKAVGQVENDDRADWTETWALFPGDVAYIWHGGLHAHSVAQSLLAADFGLRSQIIWRKQQLVIGRGDYHWQHEPCWYAVRKGRTGHYDGGRQQSSMWDINAPSGFRQMKEGPDKHQGIHSTQKPVECMRRPIMNNSSPGQAVYEPFSGSGTTIIAAEMTGRACHAIELNPAYVDVAVLRWQEFAGAAATLEGDGRTFEAIKSERLSNGTDVEEKESEAG
jgi:DNA modification methylase